MQQMTLGDLPDSDTKGAGKKPVKFIVAALVIFPVWLIPLSSATAQNLDARVQRLERILDNSALIEIVQTMDALQTEVRTLRGELEQKTFELESMRERQRKLYLDTDGRLQALEEGGVSSLDSLDDLDDIDLDEPLTAPPTPQAATRPTTQTGVAVDNRADERQEKLDYQDAYDLSLIHISEPTRPY